MTAEIISALVNMGSAGAVIAVVILFQRSQEKRDREWRDFFTALNSGNAADIADMRNVSKNIVDNLERLLDMYGQHDTRAASVISAIESIKADMAKLAARRRTNGRAAGD